MRRMQGAAPRRPAARATGRRGRTGRGWVAIVAGVAAASFAAGAFTSRSTAPSGDGTVAERSVTHLRAAAPSAKPTTAGAVSAATAFLGALRWRVLVDDERRRAEIRRFGATGATRALENVVSRGIEDVRRAVRAAPVVVRPVPIGYRVDRFSPPRAAVSVWGVALFGSGTYEPVSQWATSTIDLVWQRDAWKVAAMRNRGGPSPRWSIEELADGAASFDEYRHVP